MKVQKTPIKDIKNEIKNERILNESFSGNILSKLKILFTILSVVPVISPDKPMSGRFLKKINDERRKNFCRYEDWFRLLQ